MRRAVAAVMIRERSRCFACQLHGRSDRIGHGARRGGGTLIVGTTTVQVGRSLFLHTFRSSCVRNRPPVCVRNRPGCARSGILAPLCLFNPFFQEPVGSEVTRCLRGALVRLVASTRRSWILVAPSPRARSPLPATATHVCTCGACRAHLYSMRTFAIPRTAPDTRHRRGAIRHRGGRSNRNCGGRGSV